MTEINTLSEMEEISYKLETFDISKEAPSPFVPTPEETPSTFVPLPKEATVPEPIQIYSRFSPLGFATVCIDNIQVAVVMATVWFKVPPIA
ncbi:hypothetical protein AVEN_129340-1 [Araneus ventricosus]|uniref:Uncharacterized protein n=1 Tax=Araneus ventricosus TaxID=182803 RepID=A0A4Y2QJW3_ARAVE|nr:hypothetical protein AVEN_130555-1 [Araneus ventricosus]GBN63593.1 hypothetical protein AVEN_129340-1 [Araneus ventricosus]